MLSRPEVGLANHVLDASDLAFGSQISISPHLVSGSGWWWSLSCDGDVLVESASQPSGPQNPPYMYFSHHGLLAGRDLLPAHSDHCPARSIQQEPYSSSAPDAAGYSDCVNPLEPRGTPSLPSTIRLGERLPPKEGMQLQSIRMYIRREIYYQ